MADRLFAAPGHDYLGALFDELSCGREANPARATSDEDDLVREATRGLSPTLIFRWARKAPTWPVSLPTVG